MALTDQQRLKRVDSFFTADKTTLEYIEIENNGKTERIPLSKGINVIIGDTDRQKKSTAFLERTTSLKDSLKEIIGQSKSIQRYRPTIENTQVNFLSNTVQDYSFVSRLTVAVDTFQLF